LPLVSSIVEAFLPSLVLRIFLIVLPFLLAYMGRMEGLVSLSAVQFSVVKKLFTFQVCFSDSRITQQCLKFWLKIDELGSHNLVHSNFG
jgi:hypothetical protein